MTLPLISPQPTDFIKDFPGQNAVNCNLIDAAAGPAALSSPLHLINPTLQALTTNPNLGTGGFNNAYYYQIFNQVFIWGQFRFGTASINAGSGIYTLTLPFTVRSTLAANSRLPIVGGGCIHDNSANSGKTPITVHLRANDTLQFHIRMNAVLTNREVRESGIITWDFNDGIDWSAKLVRDP